MNDDFVTTAEMEGIADMWFALSGFANRDGNHASADEYWLEATVWHNRAMAQESF